MLSITVIITAVNSLESGLEKLEKKRKNTWTINVIPWVSLQVSFVWFSHQLLIKSSCLSLQFLLQTQHGVDESIAVIISSSHTHAIVFWLPKVGWGQQLCEIACKVCHPESD